MVGGEDESISERFFREILKNKGRFLSVFSSPCWVRRSFRVFGQQKEI